LVSLSRSGSLGAQAKAGFSPPNVSVVDDQGDVRANYTNLLSTLTTTANRPWPS